MAGSYSALGQGVLRSSDYGQTWTHVGLGSNEAVVFGTSKNVYAMYGFAVGPGGSNDPAFEVASQPGTGTWVAPGTPAGLTQGSAEVAVINDGTHKAALIRNWLRNARVSMFTSRRPNARGSISSSARSPS